MKKGPVLDASLLVAIAVSIAIGFYLESWLWGTFSGAVLIVVVGGVFTFIHERSIRGDSPQIAAHRTYRSKKWLVLGFGGVILAIVFWWLSAGIRGT